MIASGEIVASQLVVIGAQVSGQIKQLHVRIGDRINKGDLIAEIDSTTQLNKVQSSRAALKTYKAQLAARQTALRIAEQSYQREKKLKQQDATSQESFEKAENILAQSRADVAETESLVVQATIALSTDEANLGYTRITAPIDGTVVAVPVEEGQTINANQITPTIIQLADLSRMSLKIKISEADVTKVKPGLPVSVATLSYPTTYTSILESIDPAPIFQGVENSQDSNSTTDGRAIYYYGRLLIDNHNGILRIGMTVRSSINIASVNNVIIIPNAAIHESDGDKFVLILSKNNSVKKQNIETGLSDNLNSEVISGLTLGAKIVMAQMARTEIEKNIEQMR